MHNHRTNSFRSESGSRDHPYPSKKSTSVLALDTTEGQDRRSSRTPRPVSRGEGNDLPGGARERFAGTVPCDGLEAIQTHIRKPCRRTLQVAIIDLRR